jgi:hypothetical protein
VDLVAQGTPSVGGALEAVLLDGAHGPIDGHPRHDLRVREVLPRSPDLPDALIGSRPHSLEVVHQRDLEIPLRAALLHAVVTCLVQRVHHLAVHIELKLR